MSPAPVAALASAISRVPWTRVAVLLQLADRTYKRWQQLPERDRRRLRAQADDVRTRALALRKGGRRAEAVKDLGQAVTELSKSIRAI